MGRLNTLCLFGYVSDLDAVINFEAAYQMEPRAGDRAKAKVWSHASEIWWQKWNGMYYHGVGRQESVLLPY